MCAADVQPEDVSLSVVQNCKTVIESLEANYPEFASLITDVLPDVRALAASFSLSLCADNWLAVAPFAARQFDSCTVISPMASFPPLSLQPEKDKRASFPPVHAKLQGESISWYI